MTARDPKEEMQPDEPALYQGSGGGRFPVPDPTTLTTEALRREVASLQVLIEQRIKALQDLTSQTTTSLKERSDEKEVRIQEQLQSLETQLRDLVTQAADNCKAQFERISAQLAQVEALRVEQKSDTKAAVDAALTAQKEAVKEQTAAFREAVAKSEAATAEQIKQLTTTAGTAKEELRRAIDDVKERVVDVDSKANAINATAAGGALTKASLFGWIAAAVAIMAIISIIANVLTGNGP